VVFRKKSRVSIKLNHGLGNQLSLYFAGLAYSSRYQLVYDVFPANSGIKGHDSLNEILDFNLPGNFFPRGSHRHKCLNRIQQYVAYHFPRTFIFTRVFFSNVLGYDGVFFEKPGIRYLNGYFHTYAYFEYCQKKYGGLSSEAIIPLSAYAKSVESRIRECSSVAVHIRRGDYESHSSTFGLLDGRYYASAISALDLDLNKCQFYVFSDDIEAAKILMGGLRIRHIVYPEERNNLKAGEVLYLLGRANNLIIANSTLSYWAAILAKDDTQVIAPKPFYRNVELGNLHFYRENWHLIDAYFK